MKPHWLIAGAKLSPSEIICGFMEPKPDDSPGALRARGIEPRWWVDHEELGGEWQPRTLDLDALWEVEQWMIRHPVYRDLWALTVRGYESISPKGGWHLAAHQKIVILAWAIEEVVLSSPPTRDRLTRTQILIAAALGVLISGYVLLGATLKDQNNICLPIFTGCAK